MIAFFLILSLNCSIFVYSESFYIDDYEELPYKYQMIEGQISWLSEVNGYEPENGKWTYDPNHSTKCPSYGASTVADWFYYQKGGILPDYKSFMRGTNEIGINPRLLEIIYRDRFHSNPLKYLIVPVKDMVTHELATWPANGYIDLLINEPNYFINRIDPNIPNSNLEYNLFYDELSNIDDFDKIDLNKNDNTKSENNVIKALEKYGILYASEFGSSSASKLGIHHLTIVGYEQSGNDIVFKCHDSLNYGSENSKYIEDFYSIYAFIGNKDWPTFHGDFRRTGYSNLIGDIEESNKKKIISYEGDSLTDYWDIPALSDIDNDGKSEIIIGTSNDQTYGRVFAIDDDGDELWSTIDKLGNQIIVGETPTVEDLDNKGGKEVVFGDWNGKLYVVDALTGWIKEDLQIPTSTNGIRGYIFGVAVSDVNLDGKKEIIFTDFYPSLDWVSHLYGYTYENGKLIEAWEPIAIGSSSDSAGSQENIAIANIDSDDQLEIIFTTPTHLYAYDGDTLNKEIDEEFKVIYSSPVIADVNRDEEYEIIINTKGTSSSISGDYNRTYILDSEGDILKTIQHVNWEPEGTVAVANLDSDKEMEIVVNLNQDSTNKGKVSAFDGDSGTLDWDNSFDDEGDLPETIASPVIANIDGEGGKEILFYAGGYMYIIDNEGENPWDYYIQSAYGSPAIGDYDGEKDAEIAISHEPYTSGSSYGIMSYGDETIKTKGPKFLEFISDLDSNLSLISNNSFGLMSEGSAYFEVLGGLNSAPKLKYLNNILAIEGSLIQINASATDANGDPITYYYSSPFDEDGEWQTNETSEGVYEILITASDGNLSDSQYITVTVLRDDSTLTNQFDTNEYYLEFNESTTKSITLNNNSRVWLANLRLEGYSDKVQTDYQEVTPVVIEANVFNISANLSTDKDWNTYYSAGSETGVIVELQDNTNIPANLGHIVFRLRLKVGNGGHGRFGVYNYDSDYYEIVTSTIPAFNESYKDIYFDIYKESPLWATNETHFSLKADNINDFLNTDDVRWYYRYINDEFSDQRIYESEVKFINTPSYPKNITLDFSNNGDIDYKIEGELHEEFTLVNEFTNGKTKENFTFSNSSVTRYLRIPKQADILSAVFGFGNNQNISDINATMILEQGAELVHVPNMLVFDETGLINNITMQSVFSSASYCSDWTSNGTNIDYVYFGPHCADSYSWNIADVDSDGYNEYYMFKGETYKAWFRCDATSGNTVTDIIDYNNVESFGCYDGTCDENIEDNLFSNQYTDVSGSIGYYDRYCKVGSYWTGWQGGSIYRYWDTNENGQWDVGEHKENYLVLECGIDSDCDDDEYCNKSISQPNYYCTTPVCSPSCAEYEEETFSDNECSCQLKTDRCNESNTQMGDNYYCDQYHYINKIETVISINNTEVYGVEADDIIDINLAMYIQDYLLECKADEFGLCTIPINFSSEWNTTTLLNNIEVTYDNLDMDIKSQLQSYLTNNCTGDCQINLNLNTEQNTANLTKIQIYTSPNTAPYFTTTNNIVQNSSNTIEIIAYDNENEDYLNITSNNSDFYQINNTHMIWTPTLEDVGKYYVSFHVDDGIYSDDIELEIEVIPYQDLEISRYQRILNNDLRNILRFQLDNIGDIEFTNVNFTLDMDDGNTITNTNMFNLSSSESIIALVEHNYNSFDQYTLNLSAYASNISDYSQITISVLNYTEMSKLRLKDLEILEKDSYSRLFGFKILNNDTTAMPDVNWNASFGDNTTINSSDNFYLGINESIIVLVEYNYSSYDDYEAGFSASYNNLLDTKTISVELFRVILENLELLSSSGNTQVIVFEIRNQADTQTDDLNFTFNTGENTFNSNDFDLVSQEKIITLVENNYSTSGNYTVNATLNTLWYIQSSLLDIII